MVGRPLKVRLAARSCSSTDLRVTGGVVRGLQRSLAPLCFTVLAALPVGDARAGEVLKLLKRIDLPGVEGRIDHMALDTGGQRLFVAALGNNSVEVVDLGRDTVLKSLRGFAEPQGVLMLADQHELLVTNGQRPQVDVYDTRSLQRLRQIELKEDNDNIRQEVGSKRVYVGCGAGKDSALCVIDATSHAKVQEIALSGHPESFQLEQTGTRVFVNVPTSGTVEVIDRQRGRVVSTWQVNARKNFPMALDEDHHRLFVGTRDPARLLVLDTESGRIVASLDSVADADDIFYVADTGKIYVSGGEGFVYCFKQLDADRYSLLGRVPTAKGARTSLHIPERNQLLVAAPKSAAAPAQILVYVIEPH
jgi:DNA-binding beta-propeller fold protein YncE